MGTDKLLTRLPSRQAVMQADIDQNVMVETNALTTRCFNIESNFSLLENQIHNINSDAEITDENIARLGCRVTNIEHFLRERGLAMDP